MLFENKADFDDFCDKWHKLNIAINRRTTGPGEYLAFSLDSDNNIVAYADLGGAYTKQCMKMEYREDEE